MAAKRTGLGRGIGALIPTAENAQARPVDVFFPGAPGTPGATAAVAPDVEVSSEVDADTAALLAIPGAPH